MNDRDGEPKVSQDAAAEQKSLSKPELESDFSPIADNIDNPPVESETAAENDEDNVYSAAFTANPLAGAFSFAKNNIATEAQAEAGVAPVVNEANLEDEALVRRVLSGEVEAFSSLIERYKVAVFNLCARMLSDPDEAEDASQEVFLRAYNQLHTYQPGRRFSTWILSIASHYCIDMLRRRRPVMDLDSIAFWKASDQPEPEESAVASENRDEVRDLLKKLPEKYRSVTILRYWQDFSYEEIAEATGLSVATVKTRLFRARELLAKELEKQRRNGGDAGSRSQDERKFLRGRSGAADSTAKPRKVKGNQNVLP